MVKSNIVNTINYSENKRLEIQDKNYNVTCTNV